MGMIAILHLLLFVSADPVPTQDWPLFRGDSRQSGYLDNASLPDKPVLLWKVSVPEGVESTAAIVGETVYIGTVDGQIIALALKDGGTLWKYQTKAASLKASPAVRDGLVVIGD